MSGRDRRGTSSTTSQLSSPRMRVDDRTDVLQWARGAAVAGVDVFLDVLSLREGVSWEAELFNHVPTKDLFCLFWSVPASESRWVEMEWRCALGTRGLDYIHPVPRALFDERFRRHRNCRGSTSSTPLLSCVNTKKQFERETE